MTVRARYQDHMLKNVVSSISRLGKEVRVTEELDDDFVPISVFRENSMSHLFVGRILCQTELEIYSTEPF